MDEKQRIAVLNIEAALMGKWDRDDKQKFLFFLPTPGAGEIGTMQMSDDEYMLLKQDLQYNVFLKNGDETWLNVIDSKGDMTEYRIWFLSSGLRMLSVIDNKEMTMDFHKPRGEKLP